MSQRVRDGERREKLKSLFAQIFTNDRIVLEKLQELFKQVITLTLLNGPLHNYIIYPIELENR